MVLQEQMDILKPEFLASWLIIAQSPLICVAKQLKNN
jgi:hypothetical protein